MTIAPILLLAASLTASHPYALAGHATTAGSPEHITAYMPACASHATIYAESADGQDTMSAPMHHAGHGRWAGTLTFAQGNETGRWYVVSVVCQDAHGHIRQLASPQPSFTVRAR